MTRSRSIPLLGAAIALLAAARPAACYEVASFTSAVFDAARSREIAYTAYYPIDFSGVASVLVFSHGGTGSTFGHTLYPYYGTHWAAAGYLAIHVNHRPSSFPTPHTFDRPADVSFVLDQLQAGTLPLPPDLGGSLDLSAFGHAGHSYGAYTSMALAGGDFEGAPSFRDERIVAIAPISPQGAGQFGAYDDGPMDDTWASIGIPAFDLVGGDEKDSNALGTIIEQDWRLTPYERYPDVDDKYQSILPGLDHAQMGVFANASTQTYLAENTRLFFDVYLKGETAGTCLIGTSPPFEGQVLGARSDPTSGLATRCPPPIGVPEPPFASSFALAAGLVVYGRFLVRVARLGPDRRFVVTSPNEPAQPRRDEFGRFGASSSGECPVGTRPRVR